jgi:transcriptional regulator with XRE-family HTH domain
MTNGKLIHATGRMAAGSGALGMRVKLEEMLERLPQERRARVKARAAQLIAEEMSLRDLRKALGKTQVAVAKKLGLKQENVSRIEHQADLLLSTLDSYLKALGGRLRLVAEFKDRPPVTLTGFEVLKSAESDRATRAAKSRRSHLAG